MVDDGSTDKMLAIAGRSIGEFIMRYNRGSLIEWISHRTPAQARVVGNWGIGPTHTKA